MKIIFSKKGFDSCYGGYPNIIDEKGNFIIIPIPLSQEEQSSAKYKGQFYNEIKCYEKSIYEYMKENNIQKIKNGKAEPISINNEDIPCHADPNIHNFFKCEKSFSGSLGQIKSALKQLTNCKVEKDDIFLFYSWFKDKESHQDKQIIWGYLKIDNIIKNPQKLSEEERTKLFNDNSWLRYQPHWTNSDYYKSFENYIYIGTKFKVFNYNNDTKDLLTLTEKDKSRTNWLITEFKNKKFCNYKNKIFDSEGKIKVPCIGQEFIVDILDTDIEIKEWLNKLLK